MPADTLRALLDWLNVDDRKSEALIVNLEVVKDYYGKVLKSSEDLKTSACCDGGGSRRILSLCLPRCMRR